LPPARTEASPADARDSDTGIVLMLIGVVNAR